MAKFTVSALVTVSISTDVEAESAEEAKEKAADRPMMRLCWSCSGDGAREEEWRTSGELDGEPEILGAERR